VEDTLDTPQQNGLSGESTGRETLTLGVLKFFAGCLVFSNLPAVLSEWSYTIVNIFMFSLIYLVLVLPVYLKAVLKLVFSPGKAAVAVLLFYFLLFVCWGFWGNSYEKFTTDYLISSLYTGIAGAGVAVFVMISKKAGQVLIVAPFVLVARLGRRVTSMARKI